MTSPDLEHAEDNQEGYPFAFFYHEGECNQADLADKSAMGVQVTISESWFRKPPLV
jgi:hypothetical protein